MTDQMIYEEVTQMSTTTTKKFFITFVYEKNLEDQRIPLWESMKLISQNLDGPWSLLGDFNLVLHQGDRIGGVEV